MPALRDRHGPQIVCELTRDRGKVPHFAACLELLAPHYEGRIGQLDPHRPYPASPPLRWHASLEGATKSAVLRVGTRVDGAVFRRQRVAIVYPALEYKAKQYT